MNIQISCNIRNDDMPLDPSLILREISYDCYALQKQARRLCVGCSLYDGTVWHSETSNDVILKKDLAFDKLDGELRSW